MKENRNVVGELGAFPYVCIHVCLIVFRFPFSPHSSILPYIYISISPYGCVYKSRCEGGSVGQCRVNDDRVCVAAALRTDHRPSRYQCFWSRLFGFVWCLTRRERERERERDEWFENKSA